MGVLGNKNSDEGVAKILEQIENLSREVAALKGERKAQTEAVKLSDQVATLKTQIADLEINKSKLTEKHDREKREVEHMVGLEKKRQEFEISSAKRDATLSVREENLKAERERFEERMDFQSKQFDGQVQYLQKLMGKILERLPTVEAIIGKPQGSDD